MAPPELQAVPDGESPNQLTVEQLAHETGLTVRNIRSHQARGLLPPPEVRMRVGYYGPEHVARLRLIQELQAEGFNLKGIQRLLESSRGSAERLLDVRRSVVSPTGGEESEVTTAGELARRFAVSDEDAARFLDKAQRLEVLVPLGDGHFEVPSPSLLAAAEDVVGRGISLEHALEIVEDVKRHSEAISKRFVKLFMEDVWAPFAEAGMPEERWPEIVEAIRGLPPVGAQAILALYHQALNREEEAALREVTKRLSEGKR